MANNVKKVWASGKAVVNAWLAIPSGFSAEVIAQCGFDSVTVDMQHGVQDYQSMVQCFQAMQVHPVTPMVRVPWNEPGIIGKVLVASRGGKKLPKGALVDADGTLSEDPAVLYGPYSPEGPRDHTNGTGAIRAFGEHKGSGLALICELLGGALTGTGATAADRRFANGMLSFYIDPKVVDTSNYFDGEVSRYVDFIRATKPVAGVDNVLVPGDPERRTRAERTANGVPLPDDTWAAIVNTAREVGVSEASIQRAAS